VTDIPSGKLDEASAQAHSAAYFSWPSCSPPGRRLRAGLVRPTIAQRRRSPEPPSRGRRSLPRRGRWSNRPTAFRYAWQSCNRAGRSCVRVRGARRAKYRLGLREVGHRLRVVVTAYNRAGHGSARSKPTAVVTLPGGPPPPPPPPPGPPPPPPPPGYFGTDPSRDCIDRAETSCSLPNSLPRAAGTGASSIIHSSWEPCPDNYAANHTVGDGSYSRGPAATDPYWVAWAARVTLVQGQFTGTTTEMFSWAACRWGIDEDLLRAVAVIESTWHQSTWRDRCSGSDPTIGSFSVMQIKNKNCDGSLPWGGMPDVQQSTALSVDLYAARLRSCYQRRLLRRWFVALRRSDGEADRRRTRLALCALGLRRVLVFRQLVTRAL
jgi:hypothetical protein